MIATIHLEVFHILKQENKSLILIFLQFYFINPFLFLPISRFCLSTNPDIIGNICKLDLDECTTCGNEVLLGRFRIFIELNDGDVLAESESFTCVVMSGAFSTLDEKKTKENISENCIRNFDSFRC